MEFSHIGSSGEVTMVDVSNKPISRRAAVASGAVYMKAETVESIKKGLVKKGDPLSCARVSAISAAKKTPDLIPLCHPLPIDHVSVDFEICEGKIVIESRVVSTARTGVEMEALTAVSIAALTIYDMCKSVDKDMTIGEITLKSKSKEPL